MEPFTFFAWGIKPDTDASKICFLPSVMQQPESGLGRLVAEFLKSHTIRNTHTHIR
jgi:hypothetical protein